MAKRTKTKQPEGSVVTKTVAGLVAGALVGAVAVAIEPKVGAALLVVVAVIAAFLTFSRNQRDANGKWSPTKAAGGPLIGALVVGVMSFAGVQYLASSSAATNRWNTNTAQCNVNVKYFSTAPTLFNLGGWFTPAGADAVKVTVNVAGDSNCVKHVSYGSWRAPWGVNGWEPVIKQTFYKGDTFELRPGSHDLTIPVPDCFHQVDLLYGKETTANGTPSYPREQMMAAMWGGNKVCVKDAPPQPVPPAQVPTQPPVTPMPPATPVTAVEAPAALPQTGTGSNIIIIALIAIITGYLFSIAYSTQAQRAKAKRS